MIKKIILVLLSTIMLTSCASKNSENVSAENGPSTNDTITTTSTLSPPTREVITTTVTTTTATTSHVNKIQETSPPKIIDVSPVLDVLQDDDVLIMLDCFYPDRSQNDTHGVLIVQANGLVYYGFYTREYNNLFQSYIKDLANEDIDVSNIILNEKIELGYISGDELTKLKEHALSIDLNSDYYEEIPIDRPLALMDDVIRYECIKWNVNHKYERFHIVTSGDYRYKYETYDGNAWEVYKTLNDLEYVKQWKEVCAEKLRNYP